MASSGQCVVTVGTYDGVHLGHRRLIAESLAEGARLGLPTLVVTFDRHPAEVLRPERAPKLLTGLSHKLELLGELGVTEPVVLHFDLDRAHESAEDFVTQYLLGELGAVSVLVGANFRFGHRQHGDIALLQELAPQFGFTARGIELLIDDETHTVVSSSAIRAQLAAGAVQEAARLLGRPHEVRGLATPEGLEIPRELCLPAPGAYEGLLGPPEGPFRTCRILVEEREPDTGGLLRLDAPVGGDETAEGTLAARFVARVGGEVATAPALAARPDADR
jgi:riboflavin kinase/FMN adenylyltransferase